MGASEGTNEDKLLFSFGIIADVQFADKDAKPDEGGNLRWYREATEKLEKAVDAFNARNQDILYVLTLGDIVDGNVTPEKTAEDFQEVLVRLAKLETPTFHLLGNHCLTLPREVVMKEMGMTYGRYYKKEIYPGWDLVVLDSMDMCLKWPATADQYKEAVAYLEDHPLNPSNQMQEWNSGIASAQKAWLATLLRDAEREGTKLIVASHMPILPDSAPITHLMWNFDEVCPMLTASPAVVLYLCGHYHKGGYARHGNQHYVTVQGVLQAPPETEAHGYVHVYEDKIVIEGHGFVESRTLPIKDK